MARIEERARGYSMANPLISLTEDEKKFYSDDNNYIEYFIEIGITPDIFSKNNINPNSKIMEINTKLNPKIISKFPHFDKQSTAIDSTIVDYVFPNDYKAILSVVYPNPEFYSLILDNQFYSSVYPYKYVACLIIYEPLISYKKLYDTYAKKSSKDNSTISKNTFKNMYVPKCLCLASVHPYINKFEAILRAIYEYSKSGKNYFLDLIVEKLVSQTPKIPFGLKKVYLKIGENVIDLTEKRMNEFPSIHVDIKDLFSLFKIDKIIEIFKYLLYEIKILFFCSDLSLVTKTILSFLTLLKPLTYQYRILSVLPRGYYFFLEDDIPCIFGLNELYYNNFFNYHKIMLENKPLCIVDIDNKDVYLKLGDGNLSPKSFPSIPKHLKEKIYKRCEELKKNKKKEETNEAYQAIFFRFMINLLKDYPKFLKKSFNGNSNYVNDMIDKQAYINSQSSGDKEFYEKIINTQMFDEFIGKRMMPKDTKEKIQSLFFEEKLNEKLAQKKLIRGNKILEQNILLRSRDYDYIEPKEIIDITEYTKFSKLDINTINFFYQPNINNTICVPKGYVVRSGNTKNELYFDYYLFPILLSEKLFKFNCKHYTAPQNLNSKLVKINEDIIRSCMIKLDYEGKKSKSELINDVYISYIILFALTLWYTDKEERHARFNIMLQILSKIENHDMEATELLFNTLIRLGEEQLAAILYVKYNQMHINLTWKIFSMMSKILHKKQNIYTESMKESKSSKSSMNHSIRSSKPFTLKQSESKNFRTRTIKIPDNDNDNDVDDILGEEILFDEFGVCLDCKNDINLEKICNNLSNKELDKMNRFKCNKCGNFSLQKLNFKIGTDLYNPTISKNSSSSKLSIVLYSPTTLKKKLLYISNINYETNFDVEHFRINYPEEFWNAVWYFELRGIEISFMLPYMRPVRMKILSGVNKIYNSIEFITQEMTNKGHSDVVPKFEIKNTNTKIEKQQKNKMIFTKDILSIQHAYQISIIKIIGLIVYKSPDPYTRNISFNEKVLLINDSKKNKVIEKDEEKKEIGEKPKKSIMFSNSIVISDMTLTTANSSTSLENNEEYNKLMDGNINIEYEINNDKNNEKKPKANLTADEMFESINVDDAYYNYFKDYREDDDSDDDNDFGYSKK